MAANDQYWYASIRQPESDGKYRLTDGAFKNVHPAVYCMKNIADYNLVLCIEISEETYYEMERIKGEDAKAHEECKDVIEKYKEEMNTLKTDRSPDVIARAKMYRAQLKSKIRNWVDPFEGVYIPYQDKWGSEEKRLLDFIGE